MEITEKLQEAMERLNDEQREAVEHLDGPLLVIAGPGTGKTQLLSLRAANILLKRPVRPGNILCLTFTNAGVDAMRERLIRYLGRDGYGVEVSTYHAFAESIRNRYPEYFDELPGTRPASDLQRKKAMNDILGTLSADNPLYSGAQNGVRGKLGYLIGFVSQVKKSGLSTEELLAIVEQNEAAYDYIEQETDVIPTISVGMRGKPETREERVQAFVDAIDEAYEHADPYLKKDVARAPSTYTPFLVMLHERVHEEIPEGYGTGETGFKAIKGAFFDGTDRDGKFLKDRRFNARLRSAAKVVARYEAKLAKLGLYDFDDMVLDTIRAIEEHPELRDELRDRYEYVQLDEFQDTNDAQMRIVELIVGDPANRPNVMAVGDDDQAIMKFQGASVDGIEDFVSRYEPAQIVLRTNYRSVPSIVDISNRIGAGISDRLPGTADEKILSSPRDDDGLSHFTRLAFEAPEVEYYELAKDLAERTATWEGDEHPSIAVIARKHATLKSLIPYLNHFDVPFSYDVTADVFQLAPLQAYLATLRFVDAYARFDERRAAAELPRIVASEEIGILPDSAFRFAVHANSDHGGDWLAAMDDYGNGQLKGLKKRLLYWSAKARTSPIRALLTEIYQPFKRYYEEREDSHSILEMSAGLHALLDAVNNEMAVVAVPDRSRTLADFMATLEEMRKFGIAIQATLSYGEPEGVQLETVHGSKGLEFDTVFLADADEDSWYGKGGTSMILSPSNVRLRGAKESENDQRRLVFVAASRAKDELVAVRGGGSIVSDLEGEGDAESELVHLTDEDELIDVHEASWEEYYRKYPEEDRALLVDANQTRSITASLLNDFVEYDPKDPEHNGFLERRVLGFPEAPVAAFEFGTAVHAFLKDYVDALSRGRREALDEIARVHRRQILAMDFPESDLEGLARRYDRIVETFAPVLEELVAGRSASTELKLAAMSPSGVPLFGYIDLALVDDDSKEIVVVDYKTGLRNGVSSTPGYERQLRFYKYLLESSEDYRDYTVVDAMNLYVEPRRGPERVLNDPVKAALDDEEMERLSALIDAVWRRLSEADYDVSAFKEVAEALKSDGHGSDDELKAAFVDWLIEVG